MDVSEPQVAAMRAKYPGEKLVLFLDRRAGALLSHFLITIGPASGWFDLLPDFQIAEIRERERVRQ